MTSASGARYEHERTLRATDLRTRRETLAVFLRHASARVFGTWLVAIVAARIVTGGFGRGDLVAAGAGVALTGVVEWMIHRYFLHAPDESLRMTRLKTGTGHREHHLDPAELEWLLLGTTDAVVYVNLFAVVAAGWTIPLMWLIDGPWLGPFLTAWAFAAAGLLHYEWVHLLVHTRYRPRSRYYARLARHHRWHHYRNEHFWLGVTTNSGDRLLRTLPRSRDEVELSATARTLGSSDPATADHLESSGSA